MLRRKRLLIGIAIIAIIPVAAIAWWLGSPLFLNKTVNEELPFAVASNQAVAMSDASGMEATGDTMMEKSTDSMVTDKTGGAMMTDKPSDAMAMEKPDDAMMKDKPADSMAMDKSSDTMMMGGSESDAMAIDNSDAMTESSEPLRLKTGDFQDFDSFHKGSGQAIIYQGPDGSHLLRLENFSVTNGPDLHVILTTHPDPASQEDVKADGYIDLGSLKGNQGNQNYEIPSDVDVSSINSAVIYCQPFHVIFSVASLQQAG